MGTFTGEWAPSMGIFIVMAAFDAEPKNKVGHLAAWTL
jgi:hypothetical protein